MSQNPHLSYPAACLVLLALAGCAGNSLALSPSLQESTELIRGNAPQENYGIAVTDTDGDGVSEFVVAGYGAPNLALRWDGEALVDGADATLADASGKAVSIAACDVDGDGTEEIYLNNASPEGEKDVPSKLLKHVSGRWIDLASSSHEVFRAPGNASAANCIDRWGRGVYGIAVGRDGGPLSLYEWDEYQGIRDVAPHAGIAHASRSKAIATFPLFSHSMDIYVTNDRGPNFLYRNSGDGTFEEVAARYGLDDPGESGRGIAVLDSNADGRFDIAYGNWRGPARMFVQDAQGGFVSRLHRAFTGKSNVGNILSADFDNDGTEEFFIQSFGEPAVVEGSRSNFMVIPVETASTPVEGAGCAVADIDHDGRLDLLMSYGANASPLSLYMGVPNRNHWLRILPRTAAGAPARGATVRLYRGESVQSRAINASSSYLCQMEPVAHFGLGASPSVDAVEVIWPDGAKKTIASPKADTEIIVGHPGAAT